VSKIRMFGLSSFETNEGIRSEVVTLIVDDSEQLLDKEDAISRARAIGEVLVRLDNSDEAPCRILPVRLPLRWELAEPVTERPVEELWFVGSCGGRDLLYESNPNTFPGRMAAWCPTNKVRYNISLSEISECSDETRWFVRGFLVGDCPSFPASLDDWVEQSEFDAWTVAQSRFLRNGTWHQEFRVCELCGRVLIPGGRGSLCETHAPGEAHTDES
jgi:hypothetical protein